jgi:hypothetical protein
MQLLTHLTELAAALESEDAERVFLLTQELAGLVGHPAAVAIAARLLDEQRFDRAFAALRSTVALCAEADCLSG